MFSCLPTHIWSLKACVKAPEMMLLILIVLIKDCVVCRPYEGKFLVDTEAAVEISGSRVFEVCHSIVVCWY